MPLTVNIRPNAHSLRVALGTRIRRSPFFERTVEAGLTHVTAYNKMWMPAGYGDPEAEYHRLVNGVSMWDVAVERQVEVLGPDAARLAQILTPRDLSKCEVGKGKYVPICDHNGVLLNDPVLLQLEEDRFWFSIADGDMLLWARAIANERGLDVTVSEPDVSPLAIQGPKAEEVVASLCGDWVRDLKLFWFKEARIDDILVVIARSGWSKQGGFELYLMNSADGPRLWDLVAEAGAPYDIGPGNPNQSERIESGLLSWGSDTDERTNPYEVRMGRFVHPEAETGAIGREALAEIAKAGPERHQLGVVIEGDAPLSRYDSWFALTVDEARVGKVTSSVWSFGRGENIGLALVNVSVQPGDEAVMLGPDGLATVRFVDLPFT
jgi:aminomethyltransferase